MAVSQGQVSVSNLLTLASQGGGRDGGVEGGEEGRRRRQGVAEGRQAQVEAGGEEERGLYVSASP